jgi:hypothetical protein
MDICKASLLLEHDEATLLVSAAISDDDTACINEERSVRQDVLMAPTTPVGE